MKKIFVIVMSFGFILAGLMGTSAAQTQVTPPTGPSTIEPPAVDFNSGNPPSPSNFIPVGLCVALREDCEGGVYSMAHPEAPEGSTTDCEDLYDRCVTAAETLITTTP